MSRLSLNKKGPKMIQKEISLEVKVKGETKVIKQEFPFPQTINDCLSLWSEAELVERACQSYLKDLKAKLRKNATKKPKGIKVQVYNKLEPLVKQGRMSEDERIRISGHKPK